MPPPPAAGRRADQLAGQADIGLRAGALEVVDQRRQAVARRLGQAHVARNDRLEHRLAEAGADVLRDRLRQIVAAVEHGQRDAEDRQLRIERAADPLDRLQQLAQPLEREELALQRHQQMARGDQRVDRQQPSDGGQSIRQMSQRPAATASSALSSRCARSSSATSSISAPDRSTVAGQQVEPRHAGGDRPPRRRDALPISTS